MLKKLTELYIFEVGQCIHFLTNFYLPDANIKTNTVKKLDTCALQILKPLLRTDLWNFEFSKSNKNWLATRDRVYHHSDPGYHYQHHIVFFSVLNEKVPAQSSIQMIAINLDKNQEPFIAYQKSVCGSDPPKQLGYFW